MPSDDLCVDETDHRLESAAGAVEGEPGEVQIFQQGAGFRCGTLSTFESANGLVEGRD